MRVDGARVLIQLLLPTSGAASADALAIGVQGKRCMWRVLQNLRAVPSTVDGVNFVELEAKAVRQWEAIEERRRGLAERTLSATDSRPE